MQEEFLSKKTIGAIVVSFIAVIVVCCIPKFYEDVENEKIVVNQHLWSGQMDYWTDPGAHAQYFGTITEYYKTNQVWFNQISQDQHGNLVPAAENGALPITYADKGKGYVLGSVRIELPLIQEKLALIQQHYGSERRLIEELVKPTLGKVILACGPIMTSLESVSEKRNDLIYYATDQLNNGVYATKAVQVERVNAITGESEKYQQAVIVTDADGVSVRREESPFDKYGLKVSQLSIAELKYETATDDQISKQRSAELEIITAKAEAAKAQQKTIQIEEEGKQNAQAAKWEQEKIKATAVTKAQQEYEVAALEAKRAHAVAEKTIQEGRAEAEIARLKVQAGLSPLERATIEKETAIGIAQALSGSTVRWVPEVMINNGNSGGSHNGTNALDAVGLKFLMDIAKGK